MSGKRKGRSFEKEISILLSLHWSNGKRDDLFYPTSGSGSRATQRFKHKKMTEGQFGDITYTDPIGKPLIDTFNMELKSGYGAKRKTKKGVIRTNWGILDCIDSQCTVNPEQFKIFWKESCIDAKKSKREPLLIFRRNQKKICIAMYINIFHNCIDLFDVPDFPYIDLSDGDGTFTICGFNEFLSWVNLKKLIKELK